MDKTRQKLLFASACLGMLLFGITLTTLGAILPEIIQRFEISKTDAGSLFTVMNFGILLGSLIFGPVVDRFGYKTLLVVCAALLFIGMEGVAFSYSFELFTLFVWVFGFSGGVINGAANALVSDISEEGRGAGLALLGVFFGVGAFGMPLVLGSLLEMFTYTQIVSALSGIIILAFGLFLWLQFPAPKQPHSFPVKEAVSLLKHPTLILLAFILFFQSGIEIMTGGWTAAYFYEELNVESSTAVILLSFFWIGMMLNRLLLSKLLLTRSPSGIFITSIGLAFAGALILLLTHNIIAATIAVFVLGAGFGTGYPVVLGYIGDLYPKMSGTAFSVAMSIAMIGGMLLPYLAGIIGDASGLKTSFLIVPVGLAAIFILFMVVLKRFRTYHDKIINP